VGVDFGIVFDSLMEGLLKRSADHFSVRPSQNKVEVFPGGDFKKRAYV